MRRENKLRMQPRQLLAAAVVSGVVPRSMIKEEELSYEQRKQLDELIKKRKDRELLQKQMKSQGRGKGRPKGGLNN